MTRRRFDWDRAREMHARGVSSGVIARILGVSRTSVNRVCRPGGVERERARSRAKQMIGQGKCERCGGPRSRNDRAGVRFCLACANLLKRTSVREDALQCFDCREWLPDDAFYRAKAYPHRRNRRADCKACDNTTRRGRL